jgi:hypothetical protein
VLQAATARQTDQNEDHRHASSTIMGRLKTDPEFVPCRVSRQVQCRTLDTMLVRIQIESFSDFTQKGR